MPAPDLSLIPVVITSGEWLGTVGRKLTFLSLRRLFAQSNIQQLFELAECLPHGSRLVLNRYTLHARVLQPGDDLGADSSDLLIIQRGTSPGPLNHQAQRLEQ